MDFGAEYCKIFKFNSEFIELKKIDLLARNLNLSRRYLTKYATKMRSGRVQVGCHGNQVGGGGNLCGVETTVRFIKDETREWPQRPKAAAGRIHAFK